MQASLKRCLEALKLHVAAAVHWCCSQLVGIALADAEGLPETRSECMFY